MSSSRLAQVFGRATNPAILPIAPRTFGNNVPKSLHKTRRSWKPNVKRMDWPVSVLAGEGVGAESSRMAMLRGVKMQMKHVRSVEKAGGLEGVLLSRPGKQLTDFGRKLRAALFDDLHRIRRERELEGGLSTAHEPSSGTSASASPSASTTPL